jgi:hypothetical protein
VSTPGDTSTEHHPVSLFDTLRFGQVLATCTPYTRNKRPSARGSSTPKDAEQPLRPRNSNLAYTSPGLDSTAATGAQEKPGKVFAPTPQSLPTWLKAYFQGTTPSVQPCTCPVDIGIVLTCSPQPFGMYNPPRTNSWLP